LNAFHTVTEAAKEDQHVWRASGHVPAAFLYLCYRTAYVVAFQLITDFLNKINQSINQSDFAMVWLKTDSSQFSLTQTYTEQNS